MTGELKKHSDTIDAAAADAAEEAVEQAAAPTELDDAAKAAAEREARRQALYEENERAEDERARAEAERMRDVDDEDEDEKPRDTWRRCAACGARLPATIGASTSCLRASCSTSSLTPPRRHIAPMLSTSCGAIYRWRLPAEPPSASPGTNAARPSLSTS